MRELKGIGHERGLDKISPESGNKGVAYPYADFRLQGGETAIPLGIFPANPPL
jgi:hypothetical protein